MAEGRMSRPGAMTKTKRGARAASVRQRDAKSGTQRIFARPNGKTP